MITAATTTSLIATTTWLIRLDSLMPMISTQATNREMTTAGRLTTPASALAICSGMANGVSDRTFWR